jgi:hypothetical protein
VRLPLSLFSPETCVKEFHYNESFKAAGRGSEFWVGGQLVFPSPIPDYTNTAYTPVPTEKYDGTYRSQFWSVTDHVGQIYGDCDYNVNAAMPRLTGLRTPAVAFSRLPDETSREHHIRWHNHLFFNQKTFIREHEADLSRLASMYHPHFSEYQGAYNEALDHFDDPHIKINLRRQAMGDILSNNRIHGTDKMWIWKVEYKMKKDEIAKPGKYPRMIGDLGCPASLWGFRLTEMLKKAQAATDWHINGHTLRVVKSTSQSGLEGVFSNLLDPPSQGFMAGFSDDSCYSVRVGGKVYTFNVDISSCDTSHGPQVFRAYKGMYPPFTQDDCQGLINQCTSPITIYSRYDRKNRVTLRPNRPMLYSGSTMTTSINNFATSLIFLAFACVDWTNPPSENVVEWIRDKLMLASESTGYSITVEYCADYSDIQFLKNSPCYDTFGVLRALPNFGIAVRASGHCRGDLPGRGPLLPRAATFQHSLITGMYSHITSPIVEVMLRSCAPFLDTSLQAKIEAKLTQQNRQRYATHYEGTQPFTVTADEFFRRYHLSGVEQQSLFADYSHPGFGSHMNSFALRKVLTRDYGLTTK